MILALIHGPIMTIKEVLLALVEATLFDSFVNVSIVQWDPAPMIIPCLGILRGLHPLRHYYLLLIILKLYNTYNN